MKKRRFDFSLVLPKTADNVYSGHALPRILFYLIILLTLARSLIHILAPDGGAQSIATIPMNSYGTAAANAVVYLFGVWGLSQLLMGIFYLFVGLRYQSLIPSDVPLYRRRIRRAHRHRPPEACRHGRHGAGRRGELCACAAGGCDVLPVDLEVFRENLIARNALL